MSYATLLEDETVKSNYLAILQPRRRSTDFSVYSGSVYSVSFDYGDVSSVYTDGVALTEAFSTSLSAGQYYWDYTNEMLYVRTAASGNPNSVNTIITYNLYVATYDAHFYRDPLDDTTRVIYYEPHIVKSPELKQSNTDSFFGFLPAQSSSITLNNAEHVYEKHLYDSSFNRANIYVYHWLDELDVDNIKLIYSGNMSDVSYDQNKVTIKTYDPNKFLDDEFRNPTGDNFYSYDTFPALNPSYFSKPIRQIYGRVDGFVPVNIDYVQDNPTTSDNRIWAVCNGQTGISEISKTVSASPSSTTTRTYLNNCNGINVGDTIWLDGATDYYVEVTAVNRTGSQYIEHAAIGAPMASGEFAKRGFVSVVYIRKDNQVYTAKYKRDYTITTLANNASGFTFETSLESNLSLASNLSPSDEVFCRVYGRVNDVTLNAVAYGSDNTQTGNMSNPMQILVDLMKRNVGIAEADMNLTSFTTVISSVTSASGMAIPKSSTDNFPTYKDIIVQILKSELIRFYQNDDQEWEVSLVAPVGTAEYEIASDEILRGSFSHDFKYSEILSDVTVEYNKRETDTVKQGNAEDTVSAESNVAKYVHLVKKQKTFDSIHVYETDAQVLADRLSFYYGDRLGTITLKTKNRLFNTKLGNIITTQRTAQCGFDFDSETVNNRTGVVTDTLKSLNSISITLDDQKGIEDNSGDW